MKTYQCPKCKSTRDCGDASADPKDSFTPKCSTCAKDMILKEEPDAAETIFTGLLDPLASGDAPPLLSVGTTRTASTALEPNARSPKKSKNSHAAPGPAPPDGNPIAYLLALLQLLLPIFYPSSDPRINAFRNGLNLHGVLDSLPQNLVTIYSRIEAIVNAGDAAITRRLAIPVMNYLLATDRNRLRQLVHLVTTYTQRFSGWVRGHPGIPPQENFQNQGAPQLSISDPLFAAGRSPFNDGSIPRLTVLQFAVLLEELNAQGQLVNLALSVEDAGDCLVALLESPESLTRVEPEVTEWLLSLDREESRRRLETLDGHFRDLLEWLDGQQP